MRAPAILALGLALAACAPKRPPVGVQGDPERGKIALTQYACQSCHMVAGVPGSKVYVGRPLSDMGRRKVLAGAVPNDQAGLVRWIRDPQSVDPNTAMPNMGVSERDALDISAYLLTR
jgi:cytochrome c1